MSPPTSLETRPDPDLSGRRIGDYQLLRRLGRGGMAEVYLAEQLSLKRQVAFKVLKSSLAGDDAYVRRFHHEAQSAARLIHANIVQIHEVGCIGGIHYIAQEYVPGQNLKQLLARRGRGLELSLAVSILRQVAAALHRASEQNIIHRDIKPENILLSPTGEVKVADFGLARIASSEAMNLTQVGITMGTPLFMSPEQVEGKAVDPRSDIYSLGVTAYQMLAGRPPFDGDTALAIAVQHLKTEPRRLEELRPDIPPALARIVHKMLAKSPADRYQRPMDLLRDLRTLRLEGLPAAADMETVPEWDEEVLTIESRLAATQQLEKVLRHEPKAGAKWPAAVGLAALVVGSFVVGGLIAAASRPRPLLALSEDELPAVKRRDNVREQYYYALYEAPNMERGLWAVLEYFPADNGNADHVRYGRLARVKLGAFYLGQDRLDQALKAYHELAMAEESADEFRLTGLAGEAVIYHRRNEVDEVGKRLVQIADREDQILDSALKEEIAAIKTEFDKKPLKIEGKVSAAPLSKTGAKDPRKSGKLQVAPQPKGMK
jgi:serine/threonine-protein kinase